MESVVLPYALYIFMGLIFFYFALMCVNCIKHKGAVIYFFVSIHSILLFLRTVIHI